mmetsp:Transcript_17813/g.30988  ORF Transcript_17813/g.30988 Transcript_17813/m.30988 type:complete len:338 (-) Transcript_17813:262-1275(-)
MKHELFEEGLLVAEAFPDPATGIELGDEAQQALRAVLVLDVLGDMSSIGTRHFDSGRGHNIGRMQLATHIPFNEGTLWVQSGVQADHIRAVKVVTPVADQAEVARCCPGRIQKHWLQFQVNHIGEVVNVLHNAHALDDARLQRIREINNRRKCISRGGVDADVHTHARRLLELIIAHKSGQIVPHRGPGVATVGHRGGFGWVGYLQQTNALVDIIYFPLGSGDPVFNFLQTHFGAHRGVVAAPSQRSVSVSRAKTQQLIAHVVDLRFDRVAPVLCFVVRVGGQHQTAFFGFSGAHCRRRATSCCPHAYHHHACKQTHAGGERTHYHSADGHRSDLAA